MTTGSFGITEISLDMTKTGTLEAVDGALDIHSDRGSLPEGGYGRTHVNTNSIPILSMSRSAVLLGLNTDCADP